MTTSTTIRCLVIRFGVGAQICGMAPDIQAANGTWNTTTSDSLWTLNTNWTGSVIANGSGKTANFSQLNITEDTTVALNENRTIGNLIFGDTDTATSGWWGLNGPGVLTLAGGTPTITVNKLVNPLSGFAATVQTASLAETVTQLADTSAAGQLWTPAFDDYTYSTWSAAVGAGADPMSDDDQDGINNLLGYALASDPAKAGSVTFGNLISTSVEGQPVDCLTLACQRRVAATDISFQVEYSSNLSTWQTNAVLVSSTLNPDGTTREVWRSPPLAGSASGFLRVRVKTTD